MVELRTGGEGTVDAPLTRGRGRLAGRAQRVREKSEQHEEHRDRQYQPARKVAEDVGAAHDNRLGRDHGRVLRGFAGGRGSYLRRRKSADGDVAGSERRDIEPSAIAQKTSAVIDGAAGVDRGRGLGGDRDDDGPVAARGEHGLEGRRAGGVLY